MGATAEKPTVVSLWTVEDVATYVKASRSWVYSQVAAAGGIPCLRVGGLLRFDVDEVKAWTRGERKANVVTLKGGLR